MEERLQKIIARAGIASRRRAEEMMTSGLVTVNGQTITELGSKADESRDHIKVAGKLLRPDPERVYLLLHKPIEVVSTLSDPEGRRTLRDMLYGVSERVFPVGRLEYNASGLVFLTNDGALANRIQHAHHLPQTYHIKLKTLLTFEEIESLTRSTGARISRLRGKDAPWYEVTLSEPRGDALRNKLFETKHPVEKMKRMRIANLDLDSLATGAHRALAPGEVAELKRALDGSEVSSKSAERKPSGNKPVFRRPPGVEPRERKSTEGNFVSGEPNDDGPAERRPEWDKSLRNRPWERRPLGGAPVGNQSEERSQASSKPAAAKPWQHKPSGGNLGKRTWSSPVDGPRVGGGRGEGKHVWRKPIGAKAWDRKSADGRPSSSKPGQVIPPFRESAKSQPAGGKPIDGKLAERKPDWSKPMGGKPWERQRAVGNPADAKPAADKFRQDRSGHSRPVYRKIDESHPRKNKPMNGAPGSLKPGWNKPNGGKPWERKREGPPSADGKSAWGKPGERRPADGRPSGGKPWKHKPFGGKPAWGSRMGSKPAGRKPSRRPRSPSL
jgi:23S rRNA pseudouridine2605 synthase